MCDIKFRVRDKATGKIIEDRFFLDNDGRLWKWIDGHGLKTIFMNTVIIERYIGCPDSNNKNLYECDIVKCKDDWIDSEIFEIEYGSYHDYPAFDLKGNEIECTNGISHFLCCAGGSIEVIGYIYKNKKLLFKLPNR